MRISDWSSDVCSSDLTRPLLVEIQALVDSSHAPNPKRLTVGLEGNRLAMLLAVLHRHAGVSTYDQDVFVNAVGGVRITEPAADLPRSEEHTSELQSLMRLSYAVFCLKKKTHNITLDKNKLNSQQ